ncbi:flagellar hook-length control protein FliK [Pseudoalteromonas sp. McH1-7]|uniref:flagellar hook-length control protein FliK n=1 Tax=Pseudoalteromonas sp. McH1-7 TaxID=2745574 RepID=UPI00159150E1|nr:flagellar hook-length control protein FliK [Pseudoalteromonas sp. McH1-7]NUZ09540.1 flagellar hook-length control protein FliK [Pseudoalteromonas sp. McH1-7]
MNKLPITTNTTTASVISTDNSEVSKLDLTNNQPFAAKNIHISNDKLKMDVTIDGRWQTIQIALKPPTQPNQLQEAQVSIDETGKVVTFHTPKLQAQVTLTSQLFDILATLKGQTNSTIIQSSATVQPDSTLRINSLDLKVPVPHPVAQLLASESKLFANLSTQQSNTLLQIVNQFSDPLFSTTLPKSMIIKLISSQLSPINVKPLVNGVMLNINDRPISLPRIPSNWPPSSTWQKGELKAAINGVDVTMPARQIKVETIKPLSALLHQVSAIAKPITPINSTNPTSIHTLQYETPLLEVSLQQIKSSVARALQVLIGRPFGKQQPHQSNASQALLTSNNQHESIKRLLPSSIIQAQDVNQHNESKISTPLQKLTGQIKQSLLDMMRQSSVPLQQSQPPINREKLTASIIHYLQQNPSTEPKYQALPVDFEMKQKALSLLLDTFTGKEQLDTKQLRQVTQILERPLYLKTHTAPLLVDKTAQFVPYASSEQLTHSVTKEVKGIIEVLLNMPTAKLGRKDNIQGPLQQASNTIAKALKADSLSQMPELQKLVNQAFSRLLDERSISALAVKNQLESQLSLTPFSNTTSSLNQSSFTQMLERLLLSLLGGQVAGQDTSKESANQKMQALLETLLPQLKMLSPKQVADALQQPIAKELLNDLGQLHNQLQPQQSQLQTTSLGKQDSETQLIVNLLFPTKVGQEQQQTQLQIGEYKKSPKAGMPEKSVWFIRLCFDFADKGQIHAQAELMDKALECALVATSNQVKQLAEPHLATLRHKLAAHGLQVAEIDLREEASFQDKFFSEHAIINIKV